MSALLTLRDQVERGNTDGYDLLFYATAEEWEALEREAVPHHVAANLAALKWAATGDDAQGRKCVALSKLPGADVSLEEWLSKTPKADVLKAITKAALKLKARAA